MRDTGNALRTDHAGAGPRRGVRARGRSWWLAFCLCAASADYARPLDFFTLWQRPELPLNLEAGTWADYRRQALAGGRRTDDLLRVQCLGKDRRGNWVLEVLPLVQTAPEVVGVVPGEGLRLHLAPAVAERRDAIVNVVEEVRLWRDGAMRVLDRQEWRQDPLVTASFSGDFRPTAVQERPATVRVIGDRELTCRQLLFAAADTQAANLPQGRMIQAASQEVAAEVHQDIPLLGLAYVAERVRFESWLDPPGDRRLPPPQVRIEMLECFAFGRGATSGLDPAPDLGH